MQACPPSFSGFVQDAIDRKGDEWKVRIGYAETDAWNLKNKIRPAQVAELADTIRLYTQEINNYHTARDPQEVRWAMDLQYRTSPHRRALRDEHVTPHPSIAMFNSGNQARNQRKQASFHSLSNYVTWLAAQGN